MHFTLCLFFLGIRRASFLPQRWSSLSITHWHLPAAKSIYRQLRFTVVTGMRSRIFVMKCAMRNVESSNEKVERFPVILLTPRTSKKKKKNINQLFIIWNIIRSGGGQMRQRFPAWRRCKKIWSDLSDGDCCGCISAVEMIMEIVQFLKWNVNDCAGFKTAAEYNAFPVMISMSPQSPGKWDLYHRPRSIANRLMRTTALLTAEPAQYITISRVRE